MPAPIETTATVRKAEIRPGLWLDSRLALWFESLRLLAVADLHWGYAESHRARGHLLPLWGDDVIAARLKSLLRDYEPLEMVWLGDVVHAAEGSAQAEEFLRESRVPITVLAGNHDRRWRHPAAVSTQRDSYFFHHGDRVLDVPGGAIEVVGHHHPAVDWYDGAGGRLKLPALVVGPRRLIMPAFSPWARGGAGPWAADAVVWAVSAKRIFPLVSPQPATS